MVGKANASASRTSLSRTSPCHCHCHTHTHHHHHTTAASFRRKNTWCSEAQKRQPGGRFVVGIPVGRSPGGRSLKCLFQVWSCHHHCLPLRNVAQSIPHALLHLPFVESQMNMVVVGGNTEAWSCRNRQVSPAPPNSLPLITTQQPHKCPSTENGRENAILVGDPVPANSQK